MLILFIEVWLINSALIVKLERIHILPGCHLFVASVIFVLVMVGVHFVPANWNENVDICFWGITWFGSMCKLHRFMFYWWLEVLLTLKL